VLPEWATSENNINVWWKVLNDFGVDKSARMSLFALSLDEHRGHHEADVIMGMLIKKMTDGFEIRNASAYIHSSVLTARFDRQDGWKSSRKY